MKSLDYYKELFAKVGWKPPDDRIKYSFGVRAKEIGSKPAPYIYFECKIGDAVYEFADMLSSFGSRAVVFDFDLLTQICTNAFKRAGLEPR